MFKTLSLYFCLLCSFVRVGIMVVLVSYCCCKNYYKFSVFNTLLFYSSGGQKLERRIYFFALPSFHRPPASLGLRLFLPASESVTPTPVPFITSPALSLRPCDYIGPTWIIQDDLHRSTSST